MFLDLRLLRASLIALAGLAAAAAAEPSPEQAAAPVVAAERAFARHVLAKGFKSGFLAFSAEDAIMFQPGPANPRPALQRLPDAVPPGPALQWWPQWAGMARSGDLGFTTGGASSPVRYFTVWRKQANGRWKWIYDGGVPLKQPMAAGPDDPVAYLPLATAQAGSAEAAIAEIAPIEAELARRAAIDVAAAHRTYLADDALVGGSPQPSFPGRAGQIAELKARASRAELKPQAAIASAAGDMVFTRGETRWSDEKLRWGHYVRIWQKRREGWRLVVDLLLPAPGVPPA
jgi:ketosteroid isomerase-like protein